MTMKRAADAEVEADTAELIAAARAGDRAAFSRLYSRYARMVHGIALSRLRPQDAEDAVQEVFVRALNQLHALRDSSAFGGWLAAIARHVTIDAVRGTFRHAVLTEADEPRIRESQHDDLEARRTLDAVRALPEAYRETVMLRLVEGMTGPEIAARTGLTAASVRVNLYRGFRLLRERLLRVAPEREP
jgi:RNA polymerase sigma-70 factor (ECF subfamily)